MFTTVCTFVGAYVIIGAMMEISGADKAIRKMNRKVNEGIRSIRNRKNKK